MVSMLDKIFVQRTLCGGGLVRPVAPHHWGGSAAQQEIGLEGLCPSKPPATVLLFS